MIYPARVRSLTIAIAATITLLGAAGSSMAAEVLYSWTDVPFRTGAGSDFPRQGSLEAGQMFLMENCRNRYCFVTVPEDGREGWIAQMQYSRTPTSTRFFVTAGQQDPDVLTATARLNLRAGPGRDFMLIDEIPEGTLMRKTVCRNDYCYVHLQSGQQGFVLRSATEVAPIPGTDTTRETPFDTAIPSTHIPDSLSESAALRVPQVCFYQHIDYAGRKFCFGANEGYFDLGKNMGDWNDNISSISIAGLLSVNFCEHAQFRGDCRTITESTPRLGVFNDRISSISSHD